MSTLSATRLRLEERVGDPPESSVTINQGVVEVEQDSCVFATWLDHVRRSIEPSPSNARTSPPSSWLAAEPGSSYSLFTPGLAGLRTLEPPGELVT